MEASNFRKINADPKKFGVKGESNNISWQYDIIIGTSAVLYSDESLVQVKFANKGLTFLNNLALVTRQIVIEGSHIKKKWKMVSAWKMLDRLNIFEKYFKDKSKVDIDA